MFYGSPNPNSLLKSYQAAIIKFEDNIKKNFDKYLDYINKPHRGYLIKLEYYEDLKKKIFSNNGIDIISNPKCLKEIEFRRTRYFINMLLNGNNYILINNNLWEIFGIITKNNKSLKPILYIVDFHDIKFKLDDDIELKLWCPNANNIINRDSFHFYDSMSSYKRLNLYYQNIEQIYKQIFDYNKFENTLKNNLNLNIKQGNQGVFINTKWLKEWMVYIHYQKIYGVLEKIKNDKAVKNLIIYLEETEKKKKNRSQLK